MGLMTSQHTCRKNILVMWSGGIDSTYVLAKLLKETDDNIYAHHIYLKNCEHRDVAEAWAVKALGDKLAKIRPFRFTFNKIDDSTMPTMVYDMARVCFEAGAVSKAWYHHPLAVSLDEFYIGTHSDEGHNWDRWEVIKHAIRAAEYTDPKHLPPGVAPRSSFIEFKTHDWVSKKEQMNYLKTLDLLDECWFCRTPVPVIAEQTYVSCGICTTCIEVKKAMEA